MRTTMHTRRGLGIVPVLLLFLLVVSPVHAGDDPSLPVGFHPGEAGSRLAPRYSPKGFKVALAPSEEAPPEGLDALEGRLLLGPEPTRGEGHRLVLARSAEGQPYDRLWVDTDDDAAYHLVLSDANNDAVYAAGDWWTILPADGEATNAIAGTREVGDFAWAEKPVAFRHDIEAAIGDARSEGRPYFLDFETVWCGPCKTMDRWVYTAKDVVAAAAGIVCIKVDGDEQKDLKKQHGVGAFPTGILFRPDGEEIARFTGYRSVVDMVLFFAQATNRPK